MCSQPRASSVLPRSPHRSLDEAILYPLAALGFSYQLLAGFTLSFPLNILLLPLEIVEIFLRWQLTFSAPDNAATAG